MKCYETKDGLEFMRVKDEWIVVDIETSEAYQINETLKYFLEACVQPSTAEQVYAYLTKTNVWHSGTVEPDDLVTLEDVGLCLEELRELGLMYSSGELGTEE